MALRALAVSTVSSFGVVWIAGFSHLLLLLAVDPVSAVGAPILSGHARGYIGHIFAIQMMSVIMSDGSFTAVRENRIGTLRPSRAMKRASILLQCSNPDQSLEPYSPLNAPACSSSSFFENIDRERFQRTSEYPSIWQAAGFACVIRPSGSSNKSASPMLSIIFSRCVLA